MHQTEPKVPQINVGKLSRMYHFMCRSFIPVEAPKVRFEEGGERVDGDPRRAYEVIGRPATPFYDPVPADVLEAELKAEEVFGTASVPPSENASPEADFSDSLTPDNGMKSGGGADISFRGALRTGTPVGLNDVFQSSSNETYTTETTNGTHITTSTSCETVSSMPGETEPSAVGTPTNSDILRMLLPPSEPLLASSHPVKREPVDSPPKSTFVPSNGLSGIPITVSSDEELPPSRPIKVEKSRSHHRRDSVDRYSSHSSRSHRSSKDKKRDRHSSSDRHSRSRHESRRSSSRRSKSQSPLPFERSDDYERSSRRSQSHKARRRPSEDCFDASSSSGKRRRSPDYDRDYMDVCEPPRKRYDDKGFSNSAFRRSADSTRFKSFSKRYSDDRNTFEDQRGSMRDREPASRHYVSPTFPSKESKRRMEDSYNAREMSPERVSNKIDQNDNTIYEYLPNPSDLQYRNPSAKRRSMSPQRVGDNNNAVPFAVSYPNASTTPDLSQIMRAMSSSLPQRVSKTLPAISPEKPRFCLQCNRHISIVCRTVDTGKICTYGRRCGFLHPLCSCVDPNCWMDHVGHPKFCVACREKLKGALKNANSIPLGCF